METNETIVVLWFSPGFDILVTTCSESSVDSATERVSLDEVVELIILIVSLSHELESSLVTTVVAHRFENHIVSFLESNVSDILHCLNEWDHSSEAFFSFILQVRGQGVSVVNVVTTPKIHAEHEAEEILWKSTVDKWSILEQVGSLLLAEVPVSIHWRVRVKFIDS